MADEKDREPAEEKRAGIGATAGAVGGGVVGAALGSVAGPPGMVFGATVGAVAGGLVGGGEGDAARAEEVYWREHYRHEPYARSDYGYDDYSLAYRTGWEGAARHPGRSYDEVEAMLQQEYERGRGDSKPGWEDARPATRAAWQHAQQTRRDRL
ncbi:hypothetical protein LY625_08010 [Lysobacter sp. GX 14042]|uniref:hypothetical protein n=1 Tax=Lysobacter sp. GX 14042 TaxID=2907155 RepID=UPI001F26B7AC|nr:hypothetical protein [Lysobacter sp. GX 14042]MCE7032555.1 hypothetical protein [Lysobacter sp. GX 14042]